MACKIAGRFIALSQVTVVPSTDPSKQPMKKRELYMDCTRYDSITGEMIGKENKVVLEFGGDKVLDKFDHTKLEKGDVINVDFDLQGNQYTDKNTQKMRVFTAIRCFDFNIIRRAGEPMKVQQPQTAATQPQQAAHQAQQMNTQQIAQQLQAQPVNDPLPEPAPNDGLPF
jgi:hypothetical protein